MRKFGRFILINVVVLYLIQFLLGTGLDRIYHESRVYKTNMIVSAAAELSHRDGIILGGSRGLTSLDSRKIAEKTGKSIFNLSTDDTQLPVQLMQLRMMLDRHIKPQFIILDLLGTHGYSHNALRFMPLIGDQNVDNYFAQYNGKTWLLLQKAFPLFKYSYYNVELFYPAFMLLTHKHYQYRSDEVGDYKYPDSRSEIKKDTVNVLQLVPSAELEAFKKLCSENSIRLFIVVEPFYKTVVQTTDPGILNFSAIYNDHPECFYDLMHLNSNGRARYSAVVGDTLARLLITAR
jgi:hypothetical protein